mmetsp:Transcript_1924/g.6889  ORF Transcript_1924/g.6889 Transcript_1924/m.6889 type:complete len:336 (+) Transcript_1924:72-1079(+)
MRRRCSCRCRCRRCRCGRLGGRGPAAATGRRRRAGVGQQRGELRTVLLLVAVREPAVLLIEEIERVGQAQAHASQGGRAAQGVERAQQVQAVVAEESMLRLAEAALLIAGALRGVVEGVDLLQRARAHELLQQPPVLAQMLQTALEQLALLRAPAVPDYEAHGLGPCNSLGHSAGHVVVACVQQGQHAVQGHAAAAQQLPGGVQCPGHAVVQLLLGHALRRRPHQLVVALARVRLQQRGGGGGVQLLRDCALPGLAHTRLRRGCRHHLRHVQLVQLLLVQVAQAALGHRRVPVAVRPVVCVPCASSSQFLFIACGSTIVTRVVEDAFPLVFIGRP